MDCYVVTSSEIMNVFRDLNIEFTQGEMIFLITKITNKQNDLGNITWENIFKEFNIEISKEEDMAFFVNKDDSANESQEEMNEIEEVSSESESESEDDL